MKLKSITTTIVAVAAAAAAGFATAAEDGGADKPKPKGERPAGPPAEVIAKFDKDGDGKLNEAERAEAQKNRPQRPGGEGKPGDGKGRPEGGKPGDGKGRPGGGAAELFKRADKNGDNKLTEDEVPAQAWERLAKADKDSDGSVTIEELQAAGGNRPGGDRPGGGGNGERLKEMDKNGDGNLSKDEVPERAWAFMSRADKNGDEVLSKEELEAMRAAAGSGRGGPGGRPGRGEGGEGGADMFANLDKDKDGKLTEAEVPEQLWARLSKADKDADGAVSKAEMEAVRTAAGGKGGQRDGDSDGKPKRPKIES